MKGTVLKLDLDMDKKTFNIFFEPWLNSRKLILLKLYNLIIVHYDISTSSSGYVHMKLWLNREIVEETVINMLQFLCGDHPFRVKLNQMRINAGIKHWNKLFKKKRKLRPKH